MNVIIIDDETHARENLKRRLLKIDPAISIQAMAASANEGYISIMNNEPDIVFLDIEMPGGDGFSLLSRLGKFNFDVVFVTAYSEYALKAFELMAIGYITKPIDNELLAKVYNKSKNNQSGALESELLNELANKLQDLSQDNRVSIPTEKGLDLVVADHIMMFKASDGYTSIIMNDGRQMLSSKRLKHFEQNLESNFVRMHRSLIINTNYIKKYHKVGFVILNDGQELPVGRKYKKELEKMFRK